MKEFILLLFSKAIKKLHISSQRRCSIDKSSRLMSGGLYYDVEIDRYSYTGYGCNIVNCSIGAFCSIADGVNIGGASHPVSHVSTSPVFHSGKNILGKTFHSHQFDASKRTHIGNDVWIGYGAIIKAGVSIGSGAVIGAGSVVTKDIPSYEIWAGNPAKRIRPRFSEEIVVKLVESKWWEMSEEWISRHAPLFSDVENFIKKIEFK